MANPTFQDWQSEAARIGYKAPLGQMRSEYIDAYGDDKSAWEGPTWSEYEKVAKSKGVADEDMGEYRDWYEENYSRGGLDSAWTGLKRGVGHAAKTFGSFAEMAGNQEFSDELDAWGKDMAMMNPASPYGRSADFLEEPWETFTNSNFMLGGIAEMLPMQAATYAPLALSALGPAGTVAGMAGMMGVGGAFEGAQTYEEILNRGGTHDEAVSGFLKQGGSVAALNALPGGALVSKLPAPLRIPLVGLFEGSTEVAEGGTEAAILGDDIMEGLKKEANVFPLAAVTGMGFAAGTGKEVKYEEPKEEPPAVPDQTAEELIKGHWDKAKLVYKPDDPNNAENWQTFTSTHEKDGFPEINMPPDFTEADYPNLFDMSDDRAEMVPMSMVQARDVNDPAAMKRARGFMRDAKTNPQAGKRGPLTAWKVNRDDGSSYYSIRDGNTTMGILSDSGVSSVPIIVEREVSEAEAAAIPGHGATKQNIMPAEQYQANGKRALDRQLQDGQQGWTLDDHYKVARSSQTHLNAVGQSLKTSIPGVRYTHAPARASESKAGEKGRKSSETKLKKYNGDASRITDIVRGTFVVNTPNAATKLIKQLGKRFKGIDEGWNTTEQGYTDRKIQLLFDNGQVGEIQIMSRNMLAAKSLLGGHEMYKVWQGDMFKNADGYMIAKPGGDMEAAYMNTGMHIVYDHAIDMDGPLWASAYSNQSGTSSSGISRPYSKMSTGLGIGPQAPSRNTAAVQPSLALNETATSFSTTNARDGTPGGKSNIGLTSEKDIIPVVREDSYQYPVSDLKGKDISYDVFAEDTRETFTVTEDAGKVMQKLYNRLESLKQLRKCVS